CARSRYSYNYLGYFDSW
nr:immunoglobulin heavy chain junction region [Macaca mulatta]MOV54587.1 immunoglobulin heavy chain junction region [Macaca mulatta]MOV56501.1 immunoglobulin heavy chain junction region [Macaca mulatta]MOV57257.1 immunoglobulin heavy chain junction region [Macaca mulatta]